MTTISFGCNSYTSTTQLAESHLGQQSASCKDEVRINSEEAFRYIIILIKLSLLKNVTKSDWTLDNARVIVHQNQNYVHLITFGATTFLPSNIKFNQSITWSVRRSLNLAFLFCFYFKAFVTCACERYNLCHITSPWMWDPYGRLLWNEDTPFLSQCQGPVSSWLHTASPGSGSG